MWFGRWGSAAVRAYIEEAYAEMRTGLTTLFSSSEDPGQERGFTLSEVRSLLDEMIEEHPGCRRKQEEVAEKLQIKDVEVLQGIAEEVRGEKEEERGGEEALILNPTTRKLHTPKRWDKEESPSEWKTWCGWRFGCAEFEAVHARGIPDTTICKKCRRRMLTEEEREEEEFQELLSKEERGEAASEQGVSE